MKRKGIALLIAGTLFLSSCALMPEEETHQRSPVIQNLSVREYAQAPCQRGDILLTKNIRCTYVPVRTESLNFTVSGLKYDGIFVDAGDKVSKGQVLMQLEMGDLEIAMESTRRQIEQMQMQLNHLEEDRALALRRAAVQHQDAATLHHAENSINETYDAQRLSLADTLNITIMRLDDYEKQIEKRKLLSPIDGTVTYVRKIAENDRSAVNSKVITVADSTMSIFRAETEYWDRFEEGQQVTVVSNKIEYAATVVTEETLGLKAEEKTVGKTAYVYLALNEPPVDLEDGDSGTLTLLLDARMDTLYVPESAVSKINGETVAFYLDENGLRSFKPVTVGLRANDMVEIVSGLEEGQLVIVKE